jgi:glycosyltransferase involved in cell wall biosynthesis
VRPHGAEILVVDGHSSDRTREIAASKGTTVILDGGRGKGEAMRRSLAIAQHEILVFIDADGSHDPNDIPRLVEPIRRDEAELVIASRTRGGSDELHGTAEQLLRYIGSQLIMLAINYRWQVRLTDSQNGFRAIRRDVALALDLKSDLTTIEQEMLMRALKLGCRVVEVPSHEFERRWGVSKVSVWRLWWAYLWSLMRNIF